MSRSTGGGGEYPSQLPEVNDLCDCENIGAETGNYSRTAGMTQMKNELDPRLWKCDKL